MKSRHPWRVVCVDTWAFGRSGPPFLPSQTDKDTRVQHVGALHVAHSAEEPWTFNALEPLCLLVDSYPKDPELKAKYLLEWQNTIANLALGQP